jgi:hypothetical protein
MKRMIISMVLGAIVVSLLLGLVVLRGGRSGIVANAYAQGGCSVATLHGAYGFYRTGTTPFGPLVGAGISTFYGNGSSTGRQTIRRNGVTTSDLFTTPASPGIYEVDPDCAARFLNPDGSVFGHAVVVNGGKEILFMSLSDSNTIYGVMKKISTEN